MTERYAAPNGETPWSLSWRADPLSAAIADRHYNRQKVGAAQFVPPGACLVLRASAALWVTSWPFAEYVKHAWAGAWINSTFRREDGDVKASEMISWAIAHTRWEWPTVPDLGMVTFIDPTKVKGTKVRGEVVYGYSYLKAGFRHVGETQGGLLAFQITAEDMPDPMPYSGAQLLLEVE